MQVKTIKKTIINKLNDWLSTINDEELVKELRKNIVVSGGSICSMLLQEPVNDYDVYIKDIDVLKKLVNFYTKDFKEVIKVLDGRLKDTEYKEDQFRKGILGCSVRNLKPNQIKLFFEDKNGGFRVNEDVDISESSLVSRKKYIPLFFSPNAISLSDDIQIVTRFTGSIEEIHETFDFIHATNYFTFEEGVVTNKKALESILCKQLYYQGSHYPLTSIIRIKKFLKKNWNISAGEQLKIMFDIAELDLTNPDVLEEQLIGVDVAYFNILIKAIREKMENDSSFSLTKDYLRALIDKIFLDEE